MFVHGMKVKCLFYTILLVYIMQPSELRAQYVQK